MTRELVETISERGHQVTHCHMCGSSDLRLVLDLGFHPPSDGILKKEQLEEPEAHYPLRFMSCGDCGLLQIDYRVNPRLLYPDDFPYLSLTATAAGRRHFNELAADAVQRFSLPAGALVIDIGSNTGGLLQSFKELGYRPLGIDPAKNVAEIAEAAGIETLVDFFSSRLAETIVPRYGHASVITATNSFAHQHDLADAMAGIKTVLAPSGVLIIEAPYALNMIVNLEYGTIYLEHIAYLSVKPMQSFFARHGLELFDVQGFDIHGGDLRYYVGWQGAHPVSEHIAAHIAEEQTNGLYDMNVLRTFADAVGKQREALRDLLLGLKAQGKTIAGVSAPAKGSTLLNYCQIDASTIDFLTDKMASKIGKFSPGMHLPIYSDEELLLRQPDYAIILAWNFAKEIRKNLSAYEAAGGKFISPVPNPHIME